MLIRAPLAGDSLPATLAPLRACPPLGRAGEFDPCGAWEHHYSLWLSHFESRERAGRHGWLRLRRQPLADGGARLEVHEELLERDGAPSLAVAELTCAADALATPRRWHLTRFVLGDDHLPLEGTRLDELGESDGQLLRHRLEGDHARPAPPRWTTNWCLFDVVQRLGRDSAPLEFELLDEMERMRPGHRLAWCGSVKTTHHGQALELDGFELTGPGTLPWTLWRDQQQRVLVAADLQWGFVWDPNAGPPRK